MATKTRCPKCGQLNEPGAPRCQYCRAPLAHSCPRCGHARPWYLERCPRCDVTVDDAADAAVFTSLFREGPERRLQGRYLLREVVAREAVSARYRAEDLRRPGTAVAVLELSTVALFRAEERRRSEATLHSAIAGWSAVDHPALPAVVDSFSSGEAHYVVSEWVPGANLAALLEREGLKPTPDLARNWGAQLADLLAALHRQDPPLYAPFMAPGRIVVQDDGRLRLIDLGLSHLVQPGGDDPYGSARGYAAPELEGGPPTPQSDGFALGRLLYALLVGRLLERGLRRQLPLRQAAPGISQTLVKVIARAAHRDPHERYPSAEALRDALWDASAGPLEPIANWRDLMAPTATRPAPPPRGVSQPLARESAADSMEAMGFERDPRYGPAGAAAIGRALPSQPLAVALQRTETPADMPVSAARLSVQPRHAKASDLGPGDNRRLVLTLRNTGTLAIDGRVTSHVPWITAPTTAFHLPPGRQAKVIVTVRAAALPAPQATEPQALAVDSSAGRQWIAATAALVATPLLQVEPTMLDWGVFQGESPGVQHLTITNAGGQPMAGSVAPRVPWLRVASPAFRCPPARSIQVPVQLLADGLVAGEQHAEDALVIDSDGGQERVAARVRRLAPVLDLGVTHIDLGSLPAETTERYLYVANTGDGVLEGSARPLAPWLGVAPQEFRCQPGEMVQLVLTADLAALGDGAIEVPQAVRVRTNGGIETMSLRAQVLAPRLAVGGDDLTFGEARLGDVLRRTIVVANTGSAPLVASLQPLVEWLSASPATLTCAAGEERSVEVLADTTRFPRGQTVDLVAALRVEAGTTATVLAASITVLQPALRVEPQALDFGYAERTRPEPRLLTVANDGNGPLAWNAQTDVTWVEAQPTAGICRPGQSQQVTVTAYGLAADPEAEAVHGTLVINTDAGRAKVPMRLAFAAPLLASDTTDLDLGVSTNLQDVSGSLRLFSHGLGPLRGRLTTDQTWLVVDRASFECAMGRSIEVRVSTDFEELASGSTHAHGVVRIESNGGNLAIDVTVTIAYAPVIEAPASLALGRDDPSQPLQGRLTLHNSGLATAHAELRPTRPQLVLSRNRLDIKPGKSVRVIVRWQGLPDAGPEPLGIDVIAGGETIRVPVATDAT